jgi:uroporphyrinogen-III synthase
VLLLRSRAADAALPDALAASGFAVEDIRVHELVEPERPAAEPQPLAAIVCASPSAARQVLAWHPWAASASFVAIGETTRKALDALGVRRVTVASAPTDEALADAVAATALALDEEKP